MNVLFLLIVQLLINLSSHTAEVVASTKNGAIHSIEFDEIDYIQTQKLPIQRKTRKNVILEIKNKGLSNLSKDNKEETKEDNKSQDMFIDINNEAEIEEDILEKILLETKKNKENFIQLAIVYSVSLVTFVGLATCF